LDDQKQQTRQMEQTEQTELDERTEQAINVAAAAGERTEQAVAAAAGVQKDQTGSMGRMEKTEQTKQDEAGQAAKQKAFAKIAKDVAAAIRFQIAASRVTAAIQRDPRSSWPVANTTVVLFMMKSTTAGAAEHGLAQQMTSQQTEWVSKLGELQQTIDQLGELKRGGCWVQHTEAAEAQRIRADRTEATLQILGELNLNMRNEIEKQGARADLGRQIQFMRGLVDT